MATLTEKLNGIISQEIINGGFTGNFSLGEHIDEPCFKACIDSREFKNIKIEINPSHHTEEQVKEITKDIAKHEINHRGYRGFGGCPRNAEYHEKLIITPITKVLKEKGFSADDVHYLANCLEDGILQADLSRECTLDGIVGFLDDVGSHCKNKSFTGLYEAHVRLNMYLWGNSRQRKSLVKYYSKTPNETIKEVMQNFLSRSGISKLRQKIILNGKETEVKDRQKIRDFLNDENNWPEISKIFAEEFSKLMEPGYAMPILNHSGKGTSGFKGFGEDSGEPDDGEPSDEPGKNPSQSPSKGKLGQPIEKESTEPSEGNEFDKEMHSPDYKKGIIKKAFGDDSGVPEWMSHFEALDLVYQMLAKKLNIKVETFTKQSSFPIFHYGKRPFDPEIDNFKHTKFGLNDEGKAILEKRRYHEDMPLEYKVKPKGFPEVRFGLMDTSGSMKESPDRGSIGKTSIIPWGDNSKYHFALLAWYGLLEYLKQNHLLKQTNISLGNFGDSTVVRTGLYEAKKLAFNPQFGNTYIDIAKIKGLFRNKNMLVFTISDGEIQNWDDMKDEFIALARQHHYFHLQMGPANGFTEDLKRSGLHVEHIRKASDLATKVIDLTDKLYRG